MNRPQCRDNKTSVSPVKIRFDLEQIATEGFSFSYYSDGGAELPNQNRTKSELGKYANLHKFKMAARLYDKFTFSVIIMEITEIET